jgi:hypothetical protein
MRYPMWPRILPQRRDHTLSMLIVVLFTFVSLVPLSLTILTRLASPLWSRLKCFLLFHPALSTYAHPKDSYPTLSPRPHPTRISFPIFLPTSISISHVPTTLAAKFSQFSGQLIFALTSLFKYPTPKDNM